MRFDSKNKEIWHDYSLDKIVIEYTDIAVELEKDSDFMKDAIKKVSIHNNTKNKGGGTRNIHSDWKCIVIQLIDGICIRIVCDDIIVE